MKKLVPILLLATVTPFCARGEQPGGTLAGALASQGLGGAKLERRYGNHLFVPVSINNHPGALMIDTGSPNTLIDRNSVNTFGLTVEKTDSTVGGLFGRTWEREGVSKVKSIAMGNCVVTNVPVAIADLSGMNPERSAAATGSHISDSKAMAHLNGCAWGARDAQVRNDHGLQPADALHQSQRRDLCSKPESGKFPGHSRLYSNPDAGQCK